MADAREPGTLRYAHRIAWGGPGDPPSPMPIDPDDVLEVEEWDGQQWQKRGTITGKEFLAIRRSAGDWFPIPRAEPRGRQVSATERATEDRVDQHLDAAEQWLGWVGQRRREAYRMARLTDDRVRAFIELTRLAADENPRRQCWQALENAAEKLRISDDDTEQGDALRLVQGRLYEAE